MDFPDSIHHPQESSLQYDQTLSRLSSLGEDSGFGSGEPSSLGDVITHQESQNSAREHTSQLFDQSGGSFFMSGSNVSLHIPPGALAEETEIHLSVMDPSEKGCIQSSKVPRITPIVQCKPDGLQFRHPVELVVPHCGQIRSDGAHYVEVYTRCRKGENGTWKRDHEASASAVLGETTVSIFIKHFSDIDVFIKDGTDVIGKLLRVWPMVLKLNKPDDDVVLMLWICNSEEEIFKQIFHQQVSDGKMPLHGSYMHFVLKRSGISVAVAYQNESEHYSINGGIGEEIVGYEELWYGNRGAATIKLSKNGNNVGPGTLQGTLTAQQGDNPGLKFPFQKMVSEFLQSQVGGEDIIGNEIDGQSFESQSPSQSTILEIPYDLLKELSDCLDYDTISSHNWKSLACRLRFTAKQIDNIEQRDKYPTYSMLSDACKSGKLMSIEQLESILMKLERLDAVHVIQNYETDNAAAPVTKRPTEGCQAAEPMDTTSESISSSNISESKLCSFLDDDKNPPNHSTPTRSNSLMSTKSSEQGDSEDSGFFSPTSDYPDGRLPFS